MSQFTKKQLAAIKALEKVLTRCGKLDLSIFVTGDVSVRRGPLEVNEFYGVKLDGVEWVHMSIPDLDIDGGGW